MVTVTYPDRLQYIGALDGPGGIPTGFARSFGLAAIASAERFWMDCNFWRVMALGLSRMIRSILLTITSYAHGAEPSMHGRIIYMN